MASATNATASATITGNVISDANRTALETLLGLTTQTQADAVIERANKQAQVTAETARMEAIRNSLSDSGVISVSVSNTASVMTSFAAQQKADNAALLAEIVVLNARIAALETTVATTGALQIDATAQASAANAATVAGAVTTAISEAAGVPVVV